MRQVTVVFVNILGVDITTKACFHSLQRCLLEIEEVLTEQDGSLRQFIVDDKGAVAIGVFGLPYTAHEDDGVRGCTAALRIFQRLKAKNHNASVGVTTGRAFCGNVGSPCRHEYAMVGDCINTSARLMAAAGKEHLAGDCNNAENNAGEVQKERPRVYCDLPTYEMAKDMLEFDLSIPPIMMKGKALPAKVFRPLSIYEIKPECPVDRKAASRMIGRTEERKKLLAMWNATLASKDGRLIVVEGEGGIGKSTLVSNVVEHVKRDTLVSVAIGRGTHLERATPYRVWNGVLRSLLGLDGLAKVEQRKRIEELLSRLNEEKLPTPRKRLWGEVKRSIERTKEEKKRFQLQRTAANLANNPSTPLLALPLLNTILGIPDLFPSASRSEVRRLAGSNLSGEQTSNLVQDLVASLLLASKFDGALIVFEDCHYMDAASCALARHLAESPLPVCLIMTTRPRSKDSTYSNFRQSVTILFDPASGPNGPSSDSATDEFSEPSARWPVAQLQQQQQEQQEREMPETDHAYPVKPVSARLFRRMATISRLSPIIAKRSGRQTTADQAQWLSLAPLPDTAMSVLISRHFDNEKEAERFIPLVLEKAKGNPMFAESLARYIKAADCSVTDDCDGSLSSLIPDSAERLVISQIDRLTVTEQLAVKVASVFDGSDVTVQGILAVYPDNPTLSDLFDYVKVAVSEHLFEEVVPFSKYRFVSEMHRKIVYNSISIRSREVWHASLAKFLEGAGGGSPSQLAHHHERGGNWLKAAVCYVHAAKDALESSANSEAVALADRALALLPRFTPDQLSKHRVSVIARAHRTAGFALCNLGRLSDAYIYLTEALVSYDVPMSPSVAKAKKMLTNLRIGYYFRHTFPKILMGRAKNARPLEESVDISEIFEALAEVSLLNHHPVLARYAVFKCLEVAETCGDAVLMARAYIKVMYYASVGVFLLNSATLSLVERLEHYEDLAAKKVDEVGCVVLRGELLLAKCLLCCARSNLPGAIALMDRYTASKQMSLKLDRIQTDVLIMSGLYRRALKSAKRINKHSKHNFRLMECGTRSLLTVHLLCGRIKEAEELEPDLRAYLEMEDLLSNLHRFCSLSTMAFLEGYELMTQSSNDPFLLYRVKTVILESLREVKTECMMSFRESVPSLLLLNAIAFALWRARRNISSSSTTIASGRSNHNSQSNLSASADVVNEDLLDSGGFVHHVGGLNLNSSEEELVDATVSLLWIAASQISTARSLAFTFQGHRFASMGRREKAHTAWRRAVDLAASSGAAHVEAMACAALGDSLPCAELKERAEHLASEIELESGTLKLWASFTSEPTTCV